MKDTDKDCEEEKSGRIAHVTDLSEQIHCLLSHNKHFFVCVSSFLPLLGPYLRHMEFPRLVV